MNVLSLFNGMSIGLMALKNIGMEVTTYYSSEIDKFAIAESQANFPEIIQLGDVTKWKEWDIDWSSIDLLLAGFPCQAWSVAGKQGGTNDPRGMLFHTMIEIFNHIKSVNPDVNYLFENVKMKKDFEEYCSGIIGRTPHLINSENYTAHYRQRYYWISTDNFIIPPPKSSAPVLSDVLESGYVDRTKSYCLDANYFKGGDANQYFNKSRRQLVFFNDPIDRQYLIENGKNGVDYRKLSVVECCRLQGVPDDFFKVSSNTQAYKMLGNGWTVPVIEHLLREIFYERE